MNKLDINLNLYRSFYYVAKYGGFTKASNYAMISQSALSSSIKNLEDILNVKLFERNIGNLTLTKEGKDLFFKIINIIDILEESVEKKEINIGCTRFIADNYMDKPIVIFKRDNKNIKMSFNFSNTTELFQLLKKDELDIVICRYPVFYKFEKNINVEKLLDVENAFVCSKEFYLKERKNMSDSNYCYPLILPDSSEKRRRIVEYLIDNNIYYNIEVELPNSNLLKALIADNIGIGYINKKYVQKEIDDGSFVVIDKFKNIPIDNIALIYKSNINNASIKNFIDIIKFTINNTNS